MTLNITPEKGPEAIRDLLTSPDAVNGNTMDQRIIAAYERQQSKITRLTTALEAILRRVALVSPYYEMAREALADSPDLVQKYCARCDHPLLGLEFTHRCQDLMEQEIKELTARIDRLRNTLDQALGSRGWSEE